MAEQIVFRIPAGTNIKWSDVAAASLIGTRMKINACNVSMKGKVTAAKVIDDGDNVDVTIELDPDWKESTDG